MEKNRLKFDKIYLVLLILLPIDNVRYEDYRPSMNDVRVSNTHVKFGNVIRQIIIKSVILEP